MGQMLAVTGQECMKAVIQTGLPSHGSLGGSIYLSTIIIELKRIATYLHGTLSGYSVEHSMFAAW